MKKKDRRQRLIPDGIPRYIRCWDNGGGFTHFCRKCLRFADASAEDTGPHVKCPTVGCGHRMVKAGHGTADRYTVVYTGNYKGRNRITLYVGMSGNPYHPMGIGMHGESETPFDNSRPTLLGDKGAWGGGSQRRVSFECLPQKCRQLVIRDYLDIWRLGHDIQTEFHIPAMQPDTLPQAITRYWASWIQRKDDYRPLTYPPNEAILGWWCTGYDNEGWPIICALVEAADEEAAAEAVKKDWPEWVEWRFLDATKPDYLPSRDRFPRVGFMLERMEPKAEVPKPEETTQPTTKTDD